MRITLKFSHPVSVMVGLQYRRRGKQMSSAAGDRGETPGMPAWANLESIDPNS
jgi:hypothetical protein